MDKKASAYNLSSKIDDIWVLCELQLGQAQVT